MNILVTGGAGYIGSHCLRQLEIAGHRPVVVDSLVNGYRMLVPEHIPFYQKDIGDVESIKSILETEKIHAVMHFAAFVKVDESVAQPLKYYENNVAKTVQLLKAMLAVGVQKIVFSSTCAVFGQPEKLPLKENTPYAPLNPYGETKQMVECMLQSSATSGQLSFAALRYFNASGAANDGSIGDCRESPSHLIPVVIEAAMGKRDAMTVFGRDYPTPDSTCLRDYIHVDDLARAHVAVLPKLDTLGKGYYYNLGTGTPYSVLDVIAAVESVSGLKVPVIDGPRRSGDAPALYADSSLAQQDLDWHIHYKELIPIIETAWRWYQRKASLR